MCLHNNLPVDNLIMSFRLGLDSMVCDEMYRQLSEMVEHFGDRLVIPTWTKSKLGQRLQAYDQSERTRLSFELFVVSLVSRFPAILDSEATLRASLKSNIL